MRPTIGLSLELAAACSLGLLMLTAGCDAPDKNVGQETEGASETEGTSSGGVSSLTPGESDSNGSSSGTDPSESGPDTDSDSDSDTETGSLPTCDEQMNQLDCESAGCGWAEVRSVSANDGTCAFEEAEPFCFSYPADADCVDTPACGDPDSGGYWYQETGAGTWNITAVNGCDLIPGYEPCTYDGDSPAACDCACDGGSGTASLPAGWEDTVTPGGCSDFTVYAANEADTLSVTLSLFEGIAEAASGSQETFEGDFDVSDFDQLSVLVGENVAINECNDVLLKKTQIDQEWTAQSGSVSVTLVPQPDSGGEHASRVNVVFNNVVVGYAGSTYTIDGLTFEDVFVGWYPG